MKIIQLISILHPHRINRKITVVQPTNEAQYANRTLCAIQMKYEKKYENIVKPNYEKCLVSDALIFNNY